MTQLLYESRINWVHDPTPPTPRCQDDLTSPALASAENTPPSEVHHKLPRCLRPRRRRRKQPVSSVNENSASRVADPATLLGPSANENSPRLPPSAVTRWGQRPIGIVPFQDLRLEPAGHLGVLSWIIPKASSPLLCHSIPFQQPIKIEIAHFYWTTLKSGVYINRPGLTPNRIRLPTVREITSPDSASPHLLSSNPLPSPSLDRLLGYIWLISQERQGKLEGRGLESSTRCPTPLAQTRG